MRTTGFIVLEFDEEFVFTDYKYILYCIIYKPFCFQSVLRLKLGSSQGINLPVVQYLQKYTHKDFVQLTLVF